MQLVHMLLQLTAIVYSNGYCCSNVPTCIFDEIMTHPSWYIFTCDIFDNNFVIIL